MNDAKLEQLIKPLIKIYDSIELELIKDIAIRLNTYDGIEGTLKWYLDKLQEMRGFNKDNLALIAEYSGKSQKEIKEILKYAGYNMTSFDKYKEYYDDGLLKLNPSLLYDSVAIKNVIDNAIKETNSIMETIQTKAIESAKKSYMKILTDSYIKVSSGVYSYDKAIKMGLSQLAKEGFTGATYKNGKTLSLEATVRRDILTKVRQLVGSIELENAKELGTDLVYVTQHLGARIRTKYTKEDYEVHADWQGKIYKLNGSDDKHDNFYEKTGYGEMLGLCGVNCRHHFYPTFPWEKHPERLDPEENEKEYLKQQEQRRYERKIRMLKREKEIAKQLEDKLELKKINSEIRTFNIKYDKWLEDNSLKRDYNREYIVNVNKIKPKYEMYNHKTEYTIQEEQKLFETINNELDKEINIESKWSGKININNDCSPAKEWNCSITIGSSTLKQEVQHELLHARSISHYGKEEYINYQFEEEATVELLNKQILQKNKMTYYDNAYANMVNKLEEISDIIGIDKFDFAINLFKIRPSKRREWIINLAIENNKKDIILDLLEEAYPKW